MRVIINIYQYPLTINIDMDREELLHYQRSNFNTFEDTTPFKKKTEIQMPSFGKIEIDNLQKTLRQ